MTRETRILIIGDIMLDRYIFGQAKRISPEAPVPVLLEDAKRERFVPGGAGNVAINAMAAGVQVDMLSVVGSDKNGERLIGILSDAGIGTDHILVNNDRSTTTKVRFIAQNNQQILRMDSEDASTISDSILHDVMECINGTFGCYDLILLSDYNKGVLSEGFCSWIISSASDSKIPVLVDVKGSDAKKYSGATIIKPNRSELAELTGLPANSLDQVKMAAEDLLKKAECKYVLATLGADGMMLVNQNGLVKHEKTVSKEVYDVTGAGDTTIAYLAAELAKGKDIEEAMVTANLAAGVQVSKMGTSVVFPEEVERARLNYGSTFYDKQLNYYRTDGIKRLEMERKGKKVVFTNGCFDILHAGHITYLSEAKKLGDILVVGVNSDASVRRLKGEDRPINNISDRLLLLSALESVDFVMAFEEDTPYELIKAIHPDILVKGGDYNIEEIVGADVVASYGGMTTTLPFVTGKSTTGIIERMRGN